MHDATLDRQRKLAALTGMALNYGKELPAELGKMWLRLLERHPADVVEAAILKVVTEYEYKTLPPFAVLNKALRQVTGELEPEQAREVAAAAEWERVVDAARKCGRYNKPRFSETTERAIRLMGGWDAICNMETSKLEWKQKEFVEHWERFAEHADTMSLPASDILALAQGEANIAQQRAQLPKGPQHIGALLHGEFESFSRQRETVEAW